MLLCVQKSHFFRLWSRFHNRKAWLFSDTSRGARASDTCYSLIETAKANGLDTSAYIQYVLDRIADAQTLEKLEQILPWNAELEQAPKSDSVRLSARGSI